MRSEKKIIKKLQEILKIQNDYERPGADLEDQYQRKSGFLEGTINALKWVLGEKYAK